MEFEKLIKIRQSVRKYLDKPVEREKVEQCIEAARLSPSANNSQPWKFIVVDDIELCKQIALASSTMGLNKFVGQAPVIIAVVLENMNVLSAVASQVQDKKYSLIDIGIAVNQLCLQATELGLATCIVGWFNEDKVKQLLYVPKSKRVPLLITLGYTDLPIRNKTRKSFDDICSWNRY